MGPQFLVERQQDLANERVVAMPRKRVVGEQQQSVVGVAAFQTALMAAHEVRDGVGHDGTRLVGCMGQQDAVLDASQVGEVVVLDRHSIVPAFTKLLGDGRGDR